MRLGCFGFARHIPLIQKAGFDSAELDIMEIVNMTQAQFAELKRIAADSGLGFEAFSGFMPLTERIYREDFDMQRWWDHAELAADRTAQLGARLWPFGAGKCRSIPENCDDVEAVKAKFATFVAGICDRIAPYGINLAVEPLGPANSNYIQTIGEAVAFAKSLQKPNCKVMCDLRHMQAIGEDLEDIIIYKDWIIHAHIDYPLGTERLFPKKDDGYDYLPYIRMLKAAGYQGLLSVEATTYTDFLRDATSCMELLLALGAR
ncbi:MAG: sugar phosphate isomerase/epimerase family protein [Candidatus Hadarchaeum sp.]